MWKGSGALVPRKCLTPVRVSAAWSQYGDQAFNRHASDFQAIKVEPAASRAPANCLSIARPGSQRTK
jgi:hypothetical protein